MKPPLNELDEIEAPVPQWFVDAFSVPRTQRTVIAEGCPLNCFEWGQPEKPGIILLHGARAHAKIYAFIAPILAQDFHVVAYDISGMGDSGTRDSYDIDTRAREILVVAKAFGMFEQSRKPFLVGHSFGGLVGTRAMRDYGDQFGGYICVDVLSLPPEEARVFLGKNFGKSATFKIRPNKMYPSREAALARFALSPAQPCANAFLVEYAAKNSVKETPDGWTWKFDPNVYQAESREPEWLDQVCRDYAGLKVRKAFVYGSKSGQFTASSAAYFRSITTNPGPFIAITDAYHQLMFDQPLAFIDVIAGIVKIWLDTDNTLT
jgi:pimeloyl-ACP methyl ester carboxylesterase